MGVSGSYPLPARLWPPFSHGSPMGYNFFLLYAGDLLDKDRLTCNIDGRSSPASYPLPFRSCSVDVGTQILPACRIETECSQSQLLVRGALNLKYLVILNLPTVLSFCQKLFRALEPYQESNY